MSRPRPSGPRLNRATLPSAPLPTPVGLAMPEPGAMGATGAAVKMPLKPPKPPRAKTSSSRRLLAHTSAHLGFVVVLVPRNEPMHALLDRRAGPEAYVAHQVVNVGAGGRNVARLHGQ